MKETISGMDLSTIMGLSERYYLFKSRYGVEKEAHVTCKQAIYIMAESHAYRFKNAKAFMLRHLNDIKWINTAEYAEKTGCSLKYLNEQVKRRMINWGLPPVNGDRQYAGFVAPECFIYTAKNRLTKPKKQKDERKIEIRAEAYYSIRGSETREIAQQIQRAWR